MTSGTKTALSIGGIVLAVALIGFFIYAMVSSKPTTDPNAGNNNNPGGGGGNNNDYSGLGRGWEIAGFTLGGLTNIFDSIAPYIPWGGGNNAGGNGGSNAGAGGGGYDTSLG